jgi:hypothetical protein
MKTNRTLTFFGVIAVAAVVPAAAVAKPDHAKTTVQLQVISLGEASSFIAGKLSSPEGACVKGRGIEALAMHSGDGGDGKSLRSGQFQVSVGGFQPVFSAGGYEVTVPKETVGSGSHKTICDEGDADVNYKVSDLDQFDFQYTGGVFSGTLGPKSSPCAAPSRYIEVMSEPFKGSVGTTPTDQNGDWSLSSPGADTGTYRAEAAGTFGAAQNQKPNGDLDVINCDDVFAEIQVP